MSRIPYNMASYEYLNIEAQTLGLTRGLECWPQTKVTDNCVVVKFHGLILRQLFTSGPQKRGPNPFFWDVSDHSLLQHLECIKDLILRN